MKLIAPHPDTRVALDEHYSFRPLLTFPESRLYATLLQLAGNNCRVVCKPRLADFIEHHEGMGAFNGISEQHVDFLICRNEDWMPMMAIELDDKIKPTRDQQRADMFVNDLFSYIGIPLLRMHATEIDLMDQLLNQLAAGWSRRCATLQLREESTTSYA